MPDDARLPESAGPPMMPVTSMPVGLQWMLDPAAFERAKDLARFMAGAKGFVPKILEGNQFTSFAVLALAITWKLEPFGVARCIYEVNGKIGFEGKLVQSILESSGRLDGGVRYDHYGDWPRLHGKWKMVASRGGGEHAVPNWSDADEDGLGVTISCQIKGEAERRSLDFDLAEAYPRNSVLWARSPKRQICYAGVRAFASLSAPTLMLGVPFDEDVIHDWAKSLRDITPQRPVLQEFGPDGFVGPVVDPAKPAEPKPRRSRASSPLTGQKTPDPDQREEPGTKPEEQPEREEQQQEQQPEREEQQQEQPRPPEPEPEPAAAAAPAPKEPDATSTAASPGPSDTGEYDVLVPIPPTGVGTWYKPAQTKLAEMANAGRPAEDFRRFRAVNAEALRELSDGFDFWFKGIDKLVADGERDRQ